MTCVENGYTHSLYCADKIKENYKGWEKRIKSECSVRVGLCQGEQARSSLLSIERYGVVK